MPVANLNQRSNPLPLSLIHISVLVWFNQNHLKSKLQPGLQIVATGKVGKGHIRQISVTDFELLEDEADLQNFQRIVPVYRGTEKNSSKTCLLYTSRCV